MINRSFFLFATTTFLSLGTNVVIASDSFTTHITPMELKPVSFSDLDNFYQTAAICFLGSGDCVSGGFGKGDDNMSVDTANQCIQEGYSKLNCNAVQQINNVCPYNSAYGKSCVCLSNLVTCPAGQVGVGASCGGKYRSCQCSPSLVSCASNQVGSGASCGGRYQSCICKPEYQYNSSNCTSPRSLSGANCGGKYTGCSCPTGVSAGAYGCKEYYPSPCGSVCKIAYSDNCHIRTAVSTPYGCMSYFSDCPSKCERAYSDNCRSRTAVSTPYGCQQAWSDCQSKCQTAYGDNCRIRTAVSTPYGCSQYFADCTSKCQTAYADNCHNRTAVSVPANATCSSYHSDCSSKCSAWACNSGFKKSGEVCEAECSGTYGVKEGLVYECATNDVVGFEFGGIKYLLKNGEMGGVVYTLDPCRKHRADGYELPSSAQTRKIIDIADKFPQLHIPVVCEYSGSTSCFYWTRESCGSSQHIVVTYAQGSGPSSCKPDTASAAYSVCVKRIN